MGQEELILLILSFITKLTGNGFYSLTKELLFNIKRISFFAQQTLGRV